jgi:uncharacterized membrane protein YagU involved in acid resistance
VNRVVRGAVAGAVATVPMTLVIELLNRSVPRHRRPHLPPRQITEELADRSGSAPRAGERALDAATMLTHFGFGAAMGAGYATFADRLPMAAPLAGSLFGLAVWAGYYAGVMPALNLQPPPHERPAYRNATMVVGHLVWGAALGLAERALRRGGPPERSRYLERGPGYPEPVVVGPAEEIGDRPW